MGVATARMVPNFADVAPLRSLAAAGAVLTLSCASLGFDLFAVLGLWFVMFAFAMQADAKRPATRGPVPLLRRFGLLSYAFYMSFSVSELLLSQWFREQGWVPASHSLVFASGMLVVTLVLAVILHVAVEIPCRRAADRWLDQPHLALARDPL
jgi:peptidoglycan/LPS O-acetylase OafA/YrhL